LHQEPLIKRRLPVQNKKIPEDFYMISLIPIRLMFFVTSS
jgi:hypothetical protein